MGAHLRPLARCQWWGCNKGATEELYNAVHAPSGVFCSTHAKKALADFIKTFGEERVGGGWTVGGQA